MEHTMRQVDSRFSVGAWGQRSWEMNQTDKAPKGNEKVCSTAEVQYAEKNGYPETWLNWRTEESDQVWWPSWTWRLYGDGITSWHQSNSTTGVYNSSVGRFTLLLDRQVYSFRTLPTILHLFPHPFPPFTFRIPQLTNNLRCQAHRLSHLVLLFVNYLSGTAR